MSGARKKQMEVVLAAQQQEEKEGENMREDTMKILAKVISISEQELHSTVDTVHQLGQKKKADKSRQIIIQFVMRTVQDQGWKM